MLPDREALALAILLHEWVASVIAGMKQRVEQGVVLTFQQCYRDIWVQCEIDAPHPSAVPWRNPAILEFTDFILNGSLEESPEQEKYLVRYHFVMPGD